jgi:hypothetical protein
VKRGPNKRIVGAVLGGSVLILVIGYFALIAPRRSESSALKGQIADVQAQIVVARAALRPTRLQAIKAADLFPLARAMPVTTDMPDVLLQLSQIASETGITFNSISPGAPVSQGLYTELPIQLDFQGRFYDLADFLYRLRNLVDIHDGVLSVGGRLFAVGGIAFGPGDPDFPQIEATLTVEAFTYSGTDPEPVSPTLPAAASAAGAGGLG